MSTVYILFNMSFHFAQVRLKFLVPDQVTSTAAAAASPDAQMRHKRSVLDLRKQSLRNLTIKKHKNRFCILLKHALYDNFSLENASFDWKLYIFNLCKALGIEGVGGYQLCGSIRTQICVSQNSISCVAWMDILGTQLKFSCKLIVELPTPPPSEFFSVLAKFKKCLRPQLRRNASIERQREMLRYHMACYCYQYKNMKCNK